MILPAAKKLFPRVWNIIYFYVRNEYILMHHHNMDQANSLDSLASSLRGNLKYDTITRTIYSTDASMYREEPLAVAWPEGKKICRLLWNMPDARIRGL